MKETLLAAGGIAGAVAASSCCLLPLGLAAAGVGGAWIGGLAALAPWQPYFAVVAVACLGAGFWLVYRPSRRACALGPASAPWLGLGRTVRNILWVKGALWLGTALVALALGLDYGARLVL